jgi:hypothetical protein
MAINQCSEVRKRVVRFSRDLANDEIDELQTAVSMLKGTVTIDIDSRQMAVQYEFPATCFAAFWQLLSCGPNTVAFSPIDKLRWTLLASAEQNERDHLLYPRHWHTYVEDVYVDYFDYHQNSNKDVRNQLWRRYKKNSKL